MRLQQVPLFTLAIATLLGVLPQATQAATFQPVDLDQVDLGATIVGPVGPEVETTLVNAAGEGIGDLTSSVSCPAGFDSCIPPENPAGTLYLYQHQVTPGVDFPNDPPFPAPGTILPLEDATEFRLNFAAAGFTGIAGFSFAEANTAIGSTDITIEQLGDNSLIWQLPSGWGTGETITFFWQTTQPPTGPGGVYGLANAEQSGTGAGPLPAPVPIPESPNSMALLAVSGMLLVGRRYLPKK